MDKVMVDQLRQEAEHVKRAAYLSEDERAERLGLIRAQVIAFGGDPKLIEVPRADKPVRDATKRVTRSSKQAKGRRRS